MTQISLAGKHTLPDGWRSKRLKFLCSAEQSGVWGSEPENCQDPTPVATTADIDSEGKADIAGMTRRCLSREERARYMCEHGDIIVVKASGSATNVITGKAAIARSGDDAFAFGNFMLRLRPKRSLVEPEFLYRFLMSPAVKDEIKAMVSTTTYPNLQVGEYLSFSVPLPDVLQQQRLVAYLAEATGKIDRLVGLRRRQMELLQEQRAALIQQAVTRGLDPNAPLKDSGIPWLGKIPRHWEVVHLKRLLSLIEYGISEKVDVEGKYICLRMGDFSSGEISYDGVAYVDAVDERLLLRNGDLLFNRTNSLDQVGKVAIFRGHGDGNVTFASYLVRLRAGKDANPEYLNFLLNSKPVLVWASCEAIPAIGQANLNPTRYCLLRVVKPPIEEQKAIANYCDKVSRRIEELLTAYARQIEMLEEYRAALIHEAVTGQKAV